MILEAVLLLLTGWLLSSVRKTGRRSEGLPPGPPTLPLLGNIHLLAVAEGHIKLIEFAQHHGDVCSLQIGTHTLVILSSAIAAQELLDKRGASSADRPTFVSPALITNDNYLPIMRTGPTNFKNVRRAAQILLSPRQQQYHQEVQRREVLILVRDLLRDPENFYMHVYRTAVSIILTILYGKHIPSFESPTCRLVEEYMRAWSEFLHPTTLRPVDLLPSLRHLPSWMPWNKAMQHVGDLQRKLFCGLLDEFEDKRKNAISTQNPGCFMDEIMESAGEFGFDSRERLAYFAGGLIDGGGDTSASFLRSVILMLVAFPDVQKAAIAEIDAVVGERLPTLDDTENLPYLRAFINEIHRFRPTGPLGSPHSTTEDQNYQGFFIPQGTTVVMNAWGILHDPDFFDDLEEFYPERYLKDPLGLKPGVDSTGYRLSLPFGHGRRICPGMQMASDMILLTATFLVWTFRFDQAKDPLTGKVIPVDVNDCKDGLSRTPRPFKCTITARSKGRVAMIRNAIGDDTP